MHEHLKGKGYFLEFLGDFGDMIGAAILGYQMAACQPTNISSCIIGVGFILSSIYLKKYYK